MAETVRRGPTPRAAAAVSQFDHDLVSHVCVCTRISPTAAPLLCCGMMTQGLGRVALGAASLSLLAGVHLVVGILSVTSWQNPILVHVPPFPLADRS